ncbi:MAG: excinuclease ABC subunit UvrC [Clostridia bacterium]|nr:excinuclease ABC subunit UvrC [Clostridia bacterium]
MFEEKIKKLPMLPGVYIMKDKNGNVIYVGKAKKLKNRVKQYFAKTSTHTPKVAAMVEKVADFEYVICDSEIEALVLECNLIKENRPRYNSLLKDDKHYPYLKITNEDFPRLLYVRRIEKDGARYFGPYPSGFSIRETYDLIRRVFAIAHCKKRFPESIGKDRPCLYHAMGRCCAPCAGNVSSEEYKKIFDDITKLLEGREKELISSLDAKMRLASDSLEFEKAASLRDAIASIKHLSDSQKVIYAKSADTDVFAAAALDTMAYAEAFYIRNGKMVGRGEFDLSGSEAVDEAAALSDFLLQYYSGEAAVPKRVILSHKIEDADTLAQFLSQKRGNKVTVKTPERGEHKKLAEMAYKNAQKAIENARTQAQEEKLKARAVVMLAKALHLDVIPDKIEAYDISHTSGTQTVGSMVVFKAGKSRRSEYKRFKIKTVVGANDVACIQEVLTRRFTHKGDGFDELPDLLLVDGGLPQLNAALEALEELNLDIPVFGMVKDDRHKTRDVLAREGEVHLKPTSAEFRLVSAIQDEVHRFAIEYHRQLRSKRMAESELDAISGVGKVRKKALLNRFKSVRAIRDATEEELAEVKGIDKRTAKAIKDALRGEKD